MSPDNLDYFSKSTKWPERFSLLTNTETTRKEREGKRGDIAVFEETNDNQINAKVLLFKLWLLPTIVYFKVYILNFI